MARQPFQEHHPGLACDRIQELGHSDRPSQVGAAYTGAGSLASHAGLHKASIGVAEGKSGWQPRLRDLLSNWSQNDVAKEGTTR